MKMKLHITSSIFDFCNISATANAIAKFENRLSKFTENNCSKLYRWQSNPKMHKYIYQYLSLEVSV